MVTKLRLIRMMWGIKQRELAKKAGISKIFLSYLETGKRKASLKTQKKIARALGLPVEDVFEYVGKKRGA